MTGKSSEKTILITGGAGFIGSHLVRHFVKSYPEYLILNLDALTYAGNLENLREVDDLPNYRFIKADIRDKEKLQDVLANWSIDGVIHLAAESHVDRSIENAGEFVETNVQGTVNLLEACLNHWTGGFPGKIFYHVSTDEVYGSLSLNGEPFNEASQYNPSSPYAASKAASDHFVRAYGATYGLPYLISNCSNNFGPYQFPEKFIPLMVRNIIREEPLPVYGDGGNVRDWLYVEDHVEAMDLIFHKGRKRETYCIGGDNEWKNRDVVIALCRILDQKLNRAEGTSEKLIRFVKDRPGHDLRYAINFSKLFRETKWQPKTNMEQGLKKTVDWYLGNEEWLTNVTSGQYLEYYNRMYGDNRKTH
jgi:dTDP-glucose 4,6-dehydratase